MMRVLFYSLCCLLMSVQATRADLIFTGDFGAAGTGQVQITSDLVYDITTDGGVNYIVFDEIVTGDANPDGVTGSPVLNIETSALGAITGSFFAVDNLNFTFGAITANDGYFFLDGGSVAVTNGDTFTLKTGTYSFTADAAFNPAYNGLTFTGDTFLTDTNGALLSNTISAGNATAVPEPTSMALLGFGLFACGGRAYRRRRKAMKNQDRS